MNLENIKILKEGGVGVIPTDTIYGIACSVHSKEALDRIFELKNRDESKPPVVLISALSDLERFGAVITKKHSEIIAKYWPGKLTIIFDITKDLEYLDKGKGLAIRFPSDENILSFLRQTGPLATSSANTQGQIPAKNITEAQKYFLDKVDFYEDEGELDSEPSTLIKIDGDKVEVLRQGAVIIPK
jgi:tRNA threonylcarbamoyl adenosine modification protein (Sua5/YciO/YrdC/YwlC family)